MYDNHIYTRAMNKQWTCLLNKEFTGEEYNMQEQRPASIVVKASIIICCHQGCWLAPPLLLQLRLTISFRLLINYDNI